ncbi:sigma-70 family RNA polymerase sigma factor [Corallococcus exiguus]|uniref:RNA polymerase sigma factor n=1 Tax=Corallococcus TaxID=83461 RepID=UPI000F8790C0|nr:MULTISPECIES: sigma-70 family RNA polymerase sigma factor [Corallococcus]NRD53379.1 sigma-70 family RNA polymerase sigma factor [Corallococcus exiguus]NRD62602.1 sigma-70 family RNA polymerase sigma factor [Corallococcus exiguus]RUO92264.1 sigma-70 family RNA polymerase sigma factor [Corallococcus sp. AB018]
MSGDGLTLTEASIEELIHRARTGEPKALEVLLKRCQPALRKWSTARVGDGLPGGARVSDVVQESALRAFEKFSTFRGQSEGEWMTWLRRVVASQASSLVRAAQTDKRDAGDVQALDETAVAPGQSPSQFSSQQEEWRRLLTNFYGLPDDQRRALSLFHLKDLSVAEVADQMGRSPTAIESLMQRGMKTLRERMRGVEAPDAPMSLQEAQLHNAVDAAVLVYLRRCSAGERVDPEVFAASHPECADELRGMLHWMEQLRALKPPEAS